MITGRRIMLALVAVAVAASFGIAAQKPSQLFRIGVLDFAPIAKKQVEWDTFRQGLAVLGYAEGQNILIEFYSAEGRPERLAATAAEVVRSNVDVIVTCGTEPILATQRATKSIPIVMASIGDPVGAGVVTNLARPGGNVTGVCLQQTDLSAKWMELLKEILPKLDRAAVLWNPYNMSDVLSVKEIKKAAMILAVQVQDVTVHLPEDIKKSIEAAARAKPDALITTADSLILTHSAEIVDYAARYKIPVFSELSRFAYSGALLTYGPSHLDLYRRAATYVDKILKGSKPADLPIEQPTKFEFVINMKTAKTLGIKIPQSILLRADKVIE